VRPSGGLERIYPGQETAAVRQRPRRAANVVRLAGYKKRKAADDKRRMLEEWGRLANDP